MRPVLLCFDAHRADGRVWCLKLGRGKWRTAKHIIVGVPMATVYRGTHARQPKAFLRGECAGIKRLRSGALAIV